VWKLLRRGKPTHASASAFVFVSVFAGSAFAFAFAAASALVAAFATTISPACAARGAAADRNSVS
jgi:hypothetical protein